MGRRRRIPWCSLFLLVLCLGGCIRWADGEGKRTEAAYTIVKEEDLPEEIQRILEERQQEAFRMSYQTGEDLYLMRGYGIQSTGGYRVEVESVMEDADALYLKTALIGPESREDARTHEFSSPYVVVKVARSEKMVIFE